MSKLWSHIHTSLSENTHKRTDQLCILYYYNRISQHEGVATWQTKKLLQTWSRSVCCNPKLPGKCEVVRKKRMFSQKRCYTSIRWNNTLQETDAEHGQVIFYKKCNQTSCSNLWPTDDWSSLRTVATPHAFHTNGSRTNIMSC